uniref:RRM domain-containing protein n=1 Tax=Caenorhabditis japonica TaxID=281687 RepID=A0A8R1I6D5_CAEJA
MHHPVQMKPADTENRNERKLFIGQLSKKHNEENLREIFAKYGQIEDCSVLRDQDGKSRGCAFVTFTNRSCAVVATKEMHHSQTMEGCSAPLVVKFADTQKDKDVKTKSISGASAGSPKGGLLNNLSPAILQQLGGGGQNYQAVASLLSLINGQQSQQPQQQNVLGLLGTVLSALGKLTETDAEDVARISTSSSTSFSEKRPTPSTTSSGMMPSTSAPVVAAAAAASQQLGAQFLPAAAQNQYDALAMAQLAHQNQLLALQGFAVQQAAPAQHQVLPYHLFLSSPPTNHSTGSPDSASNTTDCSSSDDQKPATPTQLRRLYGGADYVKAAPGPWAAPFNPYLPAAAPMNAFGLAGGLAGAKTTSPVAATLASHQQLASLTPFAGGVDPYAIQQQYALLANLQASQVAPGAAAAAMVGNGDVKGPDGANLFIYHLPQDFGDTDLINTFAPFGTILSAKVFIDKITNLSKCFGFVSFENPHSATNAISAMNGFQIGSKRLKVQLKVDRGNPYNR